MAKAIEYVPLKDGGKYKWPVADLRLRTDQVLTDNNAVRKPGINIELTQEQQLEYLKCALDPLYFLETYCRIMTLDHGLMPFKPYEYQKEMIADYITHRFVVVATARQAGKTTSVAGFFLWYLIFNEDKLAAVLANKADQAQEIMDRFRLMYEELPYFLQKGATKYNFSEVKLENKSAIFSGSSNPDTVRGQSINILYWDEAAFTARDEEFWTSTFPTLSSGQSTKIILTSTPKGARGVFYKIWRGANETDPEKWNEFKPIAVPWHRVPGRDEAWRDSTIKKTSKSQFEQEHNIKFLGSAGTLISSDCLENLVWHNPIREDQNGHLRVYENPIKGHHYIAVADCSEGLGQDFSVCSVFDITAVPYKLVAVYRNNEVSPLLFPYVLNSLCEGYNQAHLLIESNNDVGGQVSYITHYEIEYPNIIRTKTDEKGMGCRIGGVGSKPGVKTTKRVKMIGCANLKTILENGNLEIFEEKAIEELGTFIAVGNSFEADEGCTDDIVMTMVLFSWLIKQPWFEDISTALKDKMQTTIDDIKGEMAGFFQQANPIQTPSNIPGVISVVDGIQSGISMEDWFRQ